MKVYTDLHSVESPSLSKASLASENVTMQVSSGAGVSGSVELSWLRETIPTGKKHGNHARYRRPRG